MADRLEMLLSINPRLPRTIFENKIKNMHEMAIVMPEISIGRFIFINTFQLK